jgi:protein subunit release factor B
MVDLSVSKSKQDELEAELARLGVRTEDLEESFIRSSGAGGQNVNKVSSCVVLLHKPTGIQVRCQKERSQLMNRFWARRLLVDKLKEKILGEQSRKQSEAEKIRRQKRKRSKRAKEKMLENKRFHGQKKANRGRVDSRGE